MRTTTKYGLTVPSSDTDPDDVPTHVGNLGDQIDALITSFTSGPMASIPAPHILNRYYFVDSGSGAGSLLRDTGSAWQLVNTLPGVLGDISTESFGASPVLGTPAKGYAPTDHVHGMPTDPVVPHVSASNPHSQYLLRTDTRKVGLEPLLPGYSIGTIGVTGTYQNSLNGQGGGNVAQCAMFSLANAATNVSLVFNVNTVMTGDFVNTKLLVALYPEQANAPRPDFSAAPIITGSIPLVKNSPVGQILVGMVSSLPAGRYWVVSIYIPGSGTSGTIPIMENVYRMGAVHYRPIGNDLKAFGYGSGGGSVSSGNSDFESVFPQGFFYGSGLTAMPVTNGGTYTLIRQYNSMPAALLYSAP